MFIIKQLNVAVIFNRILLSVALVTFLFRGVAFAASNSAVVNVVSSVSALQALGVAATQYPTIQVAAYYANGTSGGGFFNLTTPCPVSATDHGIYFFAAGVTGKCYVRQLSGTGVFSADWFGVVPNDLSNDYTANFNYGIAAIAAAHSATGQSYTLAVDPGQYQQTAQLTPLLGGEHLICTSAWATGCTFFQMSNYTGLTTSGAMVIGDGQNAIFGSTIEGMDIEFTSPGITVAGSIGLSAFNCQDMCGFKNDLINGWSGMAAQVIGAGSFDSTNTFVFESVASLGAQSGSVTGPAYLFSTGTYPGFINLPDALCYSGHCPTSLMEFSSLPAIVNGATLEGPATNGILIDASVPVTVIRGVTSQLQTNVVNITQSSSATDSVSIEGIYRAVGGTNTILDNGNGLGYTATITDITPPPYQRGTASFNNTVASGVNGITYNNNSSREGSFECSGATPVVVANVGVLANDIMVPTLHVLSGTQGALPVLTSITAGTSFTVVCTALDNSSYNYVLIGTQ